MIQQQPQAQTVTLQTFIRQWHSLPDDVAQALTDGMDWRPGMLEHLETEAVIAGAMRKVELDSRSFRMAGDILREIAIGDLGPDELDPWQRQAVAQGRTDLRELSDRWARLLFDQQARDEPRAIVAEAIEQNARGRVLATLQASGEPLTGRQLAERLGLSERTIREACNQLAKARIIEKIGSRKTRTYRAV